MVTALPATAPAGMARPTVAVPVALVLLCALQQGVAWLGWLPVGVGHPVFALVEMTLLALLLWHGWRLRRWVHALPGAGTGELARSTATLVFIALLVCLLGDAVNRNFADRFYSYDRVIEHSYLADSVWFFLPGYLLFVAAIWRATAAAVTLPLRLATLALGAAAGAVSFAGLVLPGTSSYIAVLTGSYSVVISLLVPAALWLLLAFGRRAWPVAAGAVLATVADALIGQFWLFGQGWYPGIAYLNMAVYFLSQALLQPLPLLLAEHDA